MANNTTAGSQAAPEIQKLRESVAAVVGELRAAEIQRTFAALSLEELIDQHLERIGAGLSTDPMKPSRADRLKSVYDDFVGSIEAIKALPAEAFLPQDPNNSANTPSGSSG